MCVSGASTPIGSSVPGTIGTPARVAAIRAAVLLPIVRIASAVGPMKMRPASRTAAAKSSFSARKPYPGCTASAPLFFATSINRSMHR
jgi:hypothetical protein